jgi:hypothetical protein
MTAREPERLARSQLGQYENVVEEPIPTPSLREGAVEEPTPTPSLRGGVADEAIHFSFNANPLAMMKQDIAFPAY